MINIFFFLGFSRVFFYKKIVINIFFKMSIYFQIKFLTLIILLKKLSSDFCDLRKFSFKHFCFI